MSALPMPPITGRLLDIVAALQTLPVRTTVLGIAATAQTPTATTSQHVAELYQLGWLERDRMWHLRRSHGRPPYGYALTEQGRRQAADRFDTPANTASATGDAGEAVGD